MDRCNFACRAVFWRVVDLNPGSGRMSRNVTVKMKVLAPLLGVALLAGAEGAQAKGCLKGAAVGAVVGHVSGHHAVLGAAAGCVVGHHMAKKRQQEEPLRHQQQVPRQVPQQDPGPGKSQA